MKRIILSSLLCLIIFNPSEIYCHENSDSTEMAKPKIGLVLSGGGAKGFAHIGVLKVIEEMGIRPDYITGTSMGSIVAGLYALGYSAAELEELVTEADWNDLLTDKITLRDIPIFDKGDYPGYPLEMSFHKGAKLSLPSGMIKGQKIQSLLSELTWSSSAYPDFDSFPIPFRCVATDIISGQGVVFKQGNLAEAMRSSMSIPTVFTPMSKDSMLLVDGGVSINFPVQVCLDMGADIIIGVYTGFDEKPKKEDLQSMIKILARSSAFQGIVDSKDQVEKTDLLIVPDLRGFGAESFNKAADIVATGEVAAREIEVLRALSEISNLNSSADSTRIIVDTSSLFINTITVEGCKRLDSLTIIKMSRLEKESLLNAEEVDEGIKKIYASSQFNQVSYHIDKAGNKNSLVLKVDEGHRGYLNLGVHYDNAYGPNALVKVSFNDFIIKSTRAIASFSISTNPRALLSYQYYPTKRRRLSISLNTYAQVEKMPDIITEENFTFTLGHYLFSQVDFNAAIAWAPFNNTMLQLKAGRQFKKITLKEGMEVYYNVNQVNYNNSYLDLSFRVNTLDDPYFPTKGAYFYMDFKNTFDAVINASDSSAFLGDLSQTNGALTIDFRYYILIKKRFSIIPELSLGLMAEKAFLTEKYFLGGNTYSLRPNHFNCAGIRSNYLATDNFVNLGVGFQYKLLKTWYLYYGAHQTIFADYADIIAAEEEEFEDYTFGAWTAGIGLASKIGPIRLLVSKSPERSEYVWYINLGVPF